MRKDAAVDHTSSTVARAPTLARAPPMLNRRSLSTPTRRLEDLPSDGGRAVDTLAGGMLRIFVRLEEMERRLTKLEKTRAETGNEHEPRV
jgi:hypothetical protein